ncbi:glycosyl hydrolase family 28 protein [Mucilaginibacter sabulilitoris]|uniref:Glycosyl hydrolase family 28 protein n=1 Tax=Mucilaginibacter sabulilitoris TaxID=1173583 RepID=A0ABZ0TS92_9SPHI|nr:glycosyl hydrolase family 28 protein [Mucilaginibacter sabulilitoris]WPU94340.1 glycosyl hydrolase family 28 protein [Mucilaginibacter sabulilitoris]
MENLSNKAVTRRNWLGAIGKVSLGTGLVALTSNAVGFEHKQVKSTGNDIGARIYNIRDFGAKGDGKTLDTAAIQSAIDTCNKEQGGTVLVPAGIFVIGTVELKSNVTLHIATQGKLLGSADGKQYHASAAIPLDGGWTMGDGNVGLIFAANAENITIEGNGTIDGQGAQFRSDTKGVLPPAGITGNHRPYHLLFYQCKNLTVRDISLINSAYHSVRVCMCSYVKLEGLYIRGKVIHNNDGFHFIGSTYVHVSNCDVQCQDDACALFGSCKFVTVSDCSFSTRWSVFRFGGGEAENIAVSNCLIYETYGCPIKMRCSPGSRFENISFSNLVMRDVTGPISIGLGNVQSSSENGKMATPGIIRNISFNNIHATVVKPVPLRDSEFASKYNPGEEFSCVVLNGVDKGFLEHISFDDVHITFPGGGTAEQAAVRDVPKVAGEYYQIGVPPAYGMYARNVRGLTLHNVRFTMASPDLRPALILDNTDDVAINGFSAQGQKSAESLLRFINSRDVLVSGMRLLTPVTNLLQAEGKECNNIKIDGGDISKAGKALVLASGALAQAVRIKD